VAVETTTRDGTKLEQQEAVRLLSLPILLRNGWRMGPKSKETLEKFKAGYDNPMEEARREYKCKPRQPKSRVS
jgi:hypothetical protein